ncbi:MAG: beta-galactosidase [Chloroflexi bacterium]|nr:beta-galactosidase [Chloroflexota bacterium]MCC6895512.1 beta-galactosidase [Anaerolineae bacterium]
MVETIQWLRSAFYPTGRNFSWILRICAVYLCLSSLSAVPARAPLETQQTVETLKPMVCVHTRLIDEVYEWKIQRSLQLVREMGATTIVEFFPWAYGEPARGQYSWASFDRIVRHAKNQGLQIIARMGLVPEWARQEDDVQTTLNYLPEKSFQDFSNFVAAFAQRYAGTVDHIIIWNEPNLSFEWGYRPVEAAGYAKLLEAVYVPAHTANPNIVILAAPLAPTLEPEGSPNGLNDILYLKNLYEAGAAPYFDALAMHTYGFTEAPEAIPSATDLNFRRAELLHQVMLEHDDPQKPVYITESGWNDNPRWTKAVRPSQRVAYTVNAFQWAENNWPWLDKLCLWVLRYPANTRSYPDNFALITPDFELTPIYYAVQAYARGKEESSQLWLPAPVQ